MFSPWFKFCNFSLTAERHSLTAERHIAAKNQSPKWTSWLLDTAWKRFFFMWFILIQKDSFRQYLGSHTVYIGFWFFALKRVLGGLLTKIYENSQKLGTLPFTLKKKHRRSLFMPSYILF